MPRTLAFPFLALSLLGLTACEPQPGATSPTSSPTATAQATTVLDRPRSPGENDGLELARWSVSGDDAKIRRALARHALNTVALGTTTDALARHGIRAAVVRDSDLPSLLAELGGTTTAISVWHGQIPEWRELASVQFGHGRVVMVDGRAEQLSGWLRCMARGWTVPLEDGAVFELHVAEQLIANQNDFSGILNRDVLRGRVFSDAVIRADLPGSTALILAGTAPSLPTDDADPEAPPKSDRSASAGPPAALPPTIGEALLSDEAAVPPRRILLVLRIRLPDTLFPGQPSPDRAAPPTAPPQPDIARPFGSHS